MRHRRLKGRVKCILLFVTAILTFVNVRNVRWSTRIQDVFTAAKLLALIVIIITGMSMLGMGESPKY